MTEIIQSDVAKRDLLETYIKYGFDDEDDLDFYIQQFLGFTIPKHSFCNGHVSPWKFLCDVFFERVNFVFAFGSRNSGKCIEGDSLILDPRSGIRHRIRDIVLRDVPDNILTLTKDGTIIQAPITARWFTGFNDC